MPPSSSVYGVQDLEHVTEDLECKPLTDYSKYKLQCEELLKAEDMGDICWTIVRPATICGFAPRMRFDLVVNIFGLHAIINKKITVHGGTQLRPNINVKDMVRAYKLLIKQPTQNIHQKTYNVGYENFSLKKLAELTKKSIYDEQIEIVYEASRDERSYKVNSDKIFKELGFKPQYLLSAAVRTIVTAVRKERIKDPLVNPLYYNIKRMKELFP
jgi:nucleoside-diphosphate-sugar epimerase